MPLNNVDKTLLTKTIKDITTTGLTYLVEHNIKGAKMIQSGLVQAQDIIDHNEILKNILKLLEPIFTVVDVAVQAWLAVHAAYLVPVYNWAKDAFAAMIGSKQIA